MTDNEIIKALECCIKHDCGNCPATAMVCGETFDMEYALDLINRQKAEIEKLKADIQEAEKWDIAKILSENFTPAEYDESDFEWCAFQLQQAGYHKQKD